MKSDYTGRPLPSPWASNTMQLESLLSFSSPDWFCWREEANKGKPGHLKLLRYKQRGMEPSISLFTLVFFQVLMFSRVENSITKCYAFFSISSKLFFFFLAGWFLWPRDWGHRWFWKGLHWKSLFLSIYCMPGTAWENLYMLRWNHPGSRY